MFGFMANLFLRGIVPQIGYPWTTVEYERAERFAAWSKRALLREMFLATLQMNAARLSGRCGKIAFQRLQYTSFTHSSASNSSPRMFRAMPLHGFAYFACISWIALSLREKV